MILSDSTLLVALHVRKMAMRKKDKQVTGEVTHQKLAEESSGSWSTNLLPGPPGTPTKMRPLAEISRKEQAARGLFYKYTLPWANDGQRILPAGVFLEFRGEMVQLRAEWDALVNQFIADYDQHIQDSAKTLGQLFDAAKYPPKEYLRNMFSLDWDYFPVPSVRDFRLNLVQEELDEVKKSMAQNLVEIEGAAIKDLLTRLAEPLMHAINVLGDSDSKFRSSTIEKVREACDLVPLLDYSSNPKLAALCEKVKETFAYDPKDIRNDDSLRAHVAKEAKTHADVLSAMFS